LWFNVDLLAEYYLSHSPYHYALNNPVNYIDLFGMAAARSNPEDDIHKTVPIDPVVVTARAPYNWDIFTPSSDDPWEIFLRVDAMRAKMDEINFAFSQLRKSEPTLWDKIFPWVPVISSFDDALRARTVGGWLGNSLLAATDVTGVTSIGKAIGKGLFKSGTKSLAKGGATVAAHGAARGYRALTYNNFRHNLGRYTGKVPANSQAHHVFPQKYRDIFLNKGINVNDPRFGVWWNSTDHLNNAYKYNMEWGKFLRTNPTTMQIFDKGRSMMLDHGIHVLY
jgi:hypothetical protein